jgi:hypothetical protein
MMDIPVHDGDAAEPMMGPRRHDGDRHVAEEAETEASIPLGMMAGRAHQGVAVGDTARRDRIEQRGRSARRQAGDLVAAGAEGREMARVAPPPVAERLDPGDVFARVEPGEIVGVDRRRRQGRHPVEQAGDLHEVAEAALGRGVLGVVARLNREPRREERRRVAGVVPEVELVEVPAGRHASSLRLRRGSSPPRARRS